MLRNDGTGGAPRGWQAADKMRDHEIQYAREFQMTDQVQHQAASGFHVVQRSLYGASGADLDALWKDALLGLEVLEMIEIPLISQDSTRKEHELSRPVLQETGVQ